jgi:hypothetical protein
MQCMHKLLAAVYSVAQADAGEKEDAGIALNWKENRMPTYVCSAATGRLTPVCGELLILAEDRGGSGDLRIGRGAVKWASR